MSKKQAPSALLFLVLLALAAWLSVVIWPRVSATVGRSTSAGEGPSEPAYALTRAALLKASGTPSGGRFAPSPTATETLAPTPTETPAGTLTFTPFPTPRITTPTPTETPIPTATSTSTPAPVLDLVIVQNNEAPVVMPGQRVTYTLVISNHSVLDATDVMLINDLPGYTTFAGASDGARKADGDLQVVIWPSFTVTTGHSVTRTLMVTVDRPMPAGIRAIINTATVFDRQIHSPDLTPYNNRYIHSTCLLNPPPDWRPYTVQPEDTLFSLASRYGIPQETIILYNCLTAEDLVAGAEIYLVEVQTVPELAGVELLLPADQATFIGWNANVVWEWRPASRPLEEDEYYVLIINHRGGAGFVWTKRTQAQAQEYDLQWISTQGPEIAWQVVIARAETLDPNALHEYPVGKEVNPYSETWVFNWYSDRAPGPSGPVPGTTPTKIPVPTVRPP